MAVGRGEIDSLLQGLEQFGEASLALSILGNVVRQNADSLIAAIADEGVQPALQEPRRAVPLEADPYDSRPMASFEKMRQLLLGRGSSAVGNIQEFVNWLAYELGKRLSNQIGETAIGGQNAAVEGNRKQQIIKSVD